MIHSFWRILKEIGYVSRIHTDKLQLIYLFYKYFRHLTCTKKSTKLWHGARRRPQIKQEALYTFRKVVSIHMTQNDTGIYGFMSYSGVHLGVETSFTLSIPPFHCRGRVFGRDDMRVTVSRFGQTKTYIFFGCWWRHGTYPRLDFLISVMFNNSFCLIRLLILIWRASAISVGRTKVSKTIASPTAWRKKSPSWSATRESYEMLSWNYR